MNDIKVVAVSGASGSGKTTIVKGLAKEFNCPFLLFDDHLSQNTYPKNMKTWFNNGANVSVIKTPKFINSLKQIIRLNKTCYIFIEEPFGKERDSISPFIDYVILLDTPLKLCLHRIIKRHFNESNRDPSHSISNFMAKYDDHMRDIYISAVNQVRDNCDLILDEQLSIQQTINVISYWLHEKSTNLENL